MSTLYDFIIPLINFISRWTLLVASVYQAKKTREKGWVLLSAAFLIDALDMESYIMNPPLGIKFNEEAYSVASVVSYFILAMLFMWGARHVKYGKTDFKDALYAALFSIVSYVWVFLVATDVGIFNNPTVVYSLPALLFGLSVMYFGYVLLDSTMPKSIERLFPYGLILLGALNLTYPVARFVDWFAPIGFLLGALFRFMAAVGAVKYVFYPVRAVSVCTVSEPTKGAFRFGSKQEVAQALEDVWSKPGTVIITRENIMEAMNKIHPESLVFWVTRAKEGVISETPQIYAVSPTNMDILTDLVANALRKGYRTVYIDSVEYLIIENGFERTMKFLLHVKDITLNANGSIILVISEETLDEKQKGMIEREFEPFRRDRASR